MSHPFAALREQSLPSTAGLMSCLSAVRDVHSTANNAYGSIMLCLALPAGVSALI
eukprot:m.129510 g.129510  ORF g.129510 m.129510 type:complete len:55 (+) comp13677_c0_seq4:245-409(+)